MDFYMIHSDTEEEEEDEVLAAVAPPAASSSISAAAQAAGATSTASESHSFNPLVESTATTMVSDSGPDDTEPPASKRPKLAEPAEPLTPHAVAPTTDNKPAALAALMAQMNKLATLLPIPHVQLNEYLTRIIPAIYSEKTINFNVNDFLVNLRHMLMDLEQTHFYTVIRPAISWFRQWLATKSEVVIFITPQIEVTATGVNLLYMFLRPQGAPLEPLCAPVPPEEDPFQGVRTLRLIPLDQYPRNTPIPLLLADIAIQEDPAIPLGWRVYMENWKRYELLWQAMKAIMSHPKANVHVERLKFENTFEWARISRFLKDVAPKVRFMHFHDVDAINPEFIANIDFSLVQYTDPFVPGSLVDPAGHWMKLLHAPPVPPEGPISFKTHRKVMWITVSKFATQHATLSRQPVFDFATALACVAHVALTRPCTDVYVQDIRPVAQVMSSYAFERVQVSEAIHTFPRVTTALYYPKNLDNPSVMRSAVINVYASSPMALPFAYLRPQPIASLHLKLVSSGDRVRRFFLDCLQAETGPISLLQSHQKATGEYYYWPCDLKVMLEDVACATRLLQTMRECVFARSLPGSTLVIVVSVLFDQFPMDEQEMNMEIEVEALCSSALKWQFVHMESTCALEFRLGNVNPEGIAVGKLRWVDVAIRLCSCVQRIVNRMFSSAVDIKLTYDKINGIAYPRLMLGKMGAAAAAAPRSASPSVAGADKHVPEKRKRTRKNPGHTAKRAGQSNNKKRKRKATVPTGEIDLTQNEENSLQITVHGNLKPIILRVPRPDLSPASPSVAIADPAEPATGQTFVDLVEQVEIPSPQPEEPVDQPAQVQEPPPPTEIQATTHSPTTNSGSIVIKIEETEENVHRDELDHRPTSPQNAR